MHFLRNALDCRERNECLEADIKLVIASGDTAKLLQTSKEPFNEVSVFIGMFIITSELLSIRSRRSNRRGVHRLNAFGEVGGIVGFIGDDGFARQVAFICKQWDVEYYGHRFYGGDGTQKEIYTGTTEEAEQEIENLQSQIDEVKALVPELRKALREAAQEKAGPTPLLHD